jgi:hypothetical protein
MICSGLRNKSHMSRARRISVFFWSWLSLQQQYQQEFIMQIEYPREKKPQH